MREWKPSALFGGLFAVGALAVIFSVDPAFFYPRLQTDPLRYLMKAHAFIETGGTTVRAAVNIPPFLYAAMPGVIRTPLIVAFKDFDDQWRAIQATNVIFAAIVALMSAYILSWNQPAKRHWMTIAFAFAFAAIAPWWVANILYPLADAPYAACTLGALIISRTLVASRKPLGSQLHLILLFAILFLFAFLIRFSAPVILVFAATLAHGRWSRENLSQRAKLLATGLPIAAVAAPIVPSVARYLASYQPFYWIFFSVGASTILAPFVCRMRSPRRVATVLAAALALAVVTLGAMRLRKVVGTANPSEAVSVLRAPAYFAGVAGPFRELREFIETLPADRTLLIGAGATTGRWKVISDRDYYVPDPNLVNVVRSKDVYLLAECGTLEVCRDFDGWTRRLEDGLSIGGRFGFETVFARQTTQAQVAVFKVSALP